MFFLSLCSYLVTYFTCLYYSFPYLLFNFSEVLVIAFLTLFINFHQFTTRTENSLKTVARVPVILQSPVSHLRLVCMCLVSFLFFFRLHFNRRSLSESVKVLRQRFVLHRNFKSSQVFSSLRRSEFVIARSSCRALGSLSTVPNPNCSYSQFYLGTPGGGPGVRLLLAASKSLPL